jgi:hypothetical protein
MIAKPIKNLLKHVNDLSGHLPGEGGNWTPGAFGVTLEAGRYFLYRAEEEDNPYFITDNKGMTEEEMVKYLTSLVYLYGFEHGGLAEVVVEA